jgi:hypothetical protein
LFNVQRDSNEADLDPRVAFTLSAPFDSKKSQQADVGSLSGLSAGTTVSLDFGLLIWPRARAEARRELPAKCRAFFPQVVPGYDYDVAAQLGGAACNPSLVRRERVEKVAKALNATAKQCAACIDAAADQPSPCALADAAQKKACGSSSDVAEILCALAKSQRASVCQACDALEKKCTVLAERSEATVVGDAEFRRIVSEHKASLTSAFKAAMPGQHGINLSLKANQLRFDHVLDTAPTQVIKNDKRGKGASLAYSYLSQTSLWAVGYSHEESYTPGTKTQVCTPLGTTGSSTCKEVTLGAPVEKAAEIAFLEHRRLFPDYHFALAPRVEFDLEDSNWAIGIPFYFLRSVTDQNALTGGFAVGYSDAADEKFSATIFVSKAFSFFD